MGFLRGKRSGDGRYLKIYATVNFERCRFRLAKLQESRLSRGPDQVASRLPRCPSDQISVYRCKLDAKPNFRQQDSQDYGSDIQRLLISISRSVESIPPPLNLQSLLNKTFRLVQQPRCAAGTALASGQGNLALSQADHTSHIIHADMLANSLP